MFGDDFSKRLLIKSFYEVVKQIAKADDAALPKEYGDDQVKKAVEKVGAYSQRFAKSFLMSTVVSLKATVKDDKIFADEKFAAVKTTLKDVETDLESTSQHFATICGKMIGAVAVLGTATLVGEETVEEKDERIKMTTGKFKRKLERLKVGFSSAGTSGYTNCSGPGIMICCELSRAPKECHEEDDICKWIVSSSKIHDWNEEVECDVCGSVVLIEPHATLSSGEIKCSMTEYGEAVRQIQLRLGLVEFILQVLFGDRFHDIIKKGHIFVLDKVEKDQRNGPADKEGVSIFLHSTDMGED